MTLERLYNYLIKIEFGTLALKLRQFSKDLSLFEHPNELISHIDKAVWLAQRKQSKLSLPLGRRVLKLEGMSSEPVRHLLNNLCSIRKANYLEIGSWKGASLISSGYGNKINQFAIDNWSQFDGPSDIFYSNVKSLLRKRPPIFWDIDCFSPEASTLLEPNSIHIYLFDGEHSEESQYLAFKHYHHVFKDTFIAIVDDYNLPAVQKGTQRAIKDLGYQKLYEKELFSKYNGDLSSWWNGLYIAVLKKS